MCRWRWERRRKWNMEGFTEAERIAAAWSKMHALEGSLFKKEQDYMKNRDNKRYEKDKLRKRSRSRSHRRSRSRDRSREKMRGRSTSRSRKIKKRSHSRDNKLEKRDERDQPTYSPYRGNPDLRVSPTYSPYRGNRDKSPEYIPRSPGRTRDCRKRSKSRSRSPSSSSVSKKREDLARLPPPPDPVRPDHDTRYQDRPKSRKDRISYHSRSRSTDREKNSQVFSKWSHDRFTAADYDRFVSY